MLANGLGGPVSAWHPYIRRWKGKYRVLTWDYRGLYGSVLPSRDTDLSVRSHVGDLRAVLDAANIKAAHLIGWSMGVQVGLELYSETPERLLSLVLTNGTYGSPLRGVPLPFSEVTLPPVVRGVQKMHGLGSIVLNRLSNSRLSFSVLRRLRIIAPGLKRERFQEMIDEFKSVNLDIYFDLLARLGEHDAEHTLPTIRIPTLVVAGSRDILTPPALARRICNQVPGAELFVIPGGTHYAAAEYPELIAARVEKFLKPFDASANRCNSSRLTP